LQKWSNAEQIKILEHARTQLTLDLSGRASGYVSPEKFKTNFLDYYQEFVDQNKREGNRHLQGSLTQLTKFLSDQLDRTSLPHTLISEEFCKKFRQFLLDNFNGQTPANYFQ
jgi:hypothetical protein